MKLKIPIVIFIFYASFACNKTANAPDRILVDLSFINTSTPKTQLNGQDIISAIRCSGENLCYNFSNFEIKKITAREFEIHAKGTFPNNAKGDVVCLDAIYYKDTTVRINTTTTGKYLLHFYNHNYLFKTDTVEVN